MRILIHGINFLPELTGTGKYTGEMAAWLAARGHDVRVVTAPPYYPQWRVGEGYAAGRYARETVEGVTVRRCPLHIPARPGGVARLLHLVSFAVSSAPMMLAQIAWRPDVVMTIEPTLANAPAALVVAALSGARSWLHVQDLEVDAAFDLGVLRSAPLRRLALSFERLVLRCFDRVSTISDGMAARLRLKGVDPYLLPNWSALDAIRPLDAPSPLRAELGLGDGEIVVLYAGNFGVKQGLETLVDAARALAEVPGITFALCGEGASYGRMQSLAAGLVNVRFLPLQPLSRLNDLLNAADIHVLPQRADAADLVMPSKLTGILASGRPVVATAHPGTQVAEVAAGCGVVVPPGDASALAKAIAELAADRERRLALGRAGRAYAEKHWDREAILEGLATEFTRIVNNR